MGRWFTARLGWLLSMLLGITFVTFVMLDLPDVDRAELAVARSAETTDWADAKARDEAILRLRIRYGMVDETGRPAPLWRRYTSWLANAATLRFAGPNEDNAAFWRRLGEAWPVTAWLGFLSLLVAFGVGMPLGAWLGLHPGGAADRVFSPLLLLFAGVPEFLLATLLLLAFGGAWLQWMPANGLRSNGAEQWTMLWQVVDFAHHLVLPVVVMSLGPLVLVSRFVRDSVARARTSPFALNLQALGLEPSTVRWRLLRHGCTPVATLAGSLLPMLVGGSIVVENLFSLDGLGHLAYQAVLDQDQAMVMAIVVLTSVVTLLSLLASDLLHRVVDPRVRMAT